MTKTPIRTRAFLLASLALSGPVGAQCELAEIFPSTGSMMGSMSDRFGLSVAVENGRALVGAPRDDAAGPESGAAVEFQRQAGAWVETAEFTASDTVAGDWFGTSIAIEGGRAVVGAVKAHERGLETGAAYVFELQAGTWVEVARLVASIGQEGDRFGSAVAISGSTILVGAPFSDTLGVRTGRAHVFQENAGSWTETQVLFSSAPYDQERFGRAVALDPGRMLIGGPGVGAGPGTTFAFELSGNTWVETQVFTGSYPLFGHGVQIDGAHAIVTSPLDQTVTVFDWAGTWVQGPLLSTSCGSAVLDGDRLFGGLCSFDQSHRAFRFDGTGWVPLGDLAHTGTSFQNNGHSMAVEGDELLSGGPTLNSFAPGVLRIYDVGSMAVYCSAKLNSLGCLPTILASGEPTFPAFFPSTPLEIRAANVRNRRTGLLFFGYGRAAQPFLGGTLCVQPPLVRTVAQDSGGSPPSAADCTGTYAFNLLDWAGFQGTPIPPGTTINAQYWSRDPDASFGIGLTNAYEVTVCP